MVRDYLLPPHWLKRILNTLVEARSSNIACALVLWGVKISHVWTRAFSNVETMFA